MKKNLATDHRARAGEATSSCILAGMEAPPNYGAEYARRSGRRIAISRRSTRCTFIPFLLDKVAGQPALNQGDGIHPESEGAAIVADTVWNVLKPLLDQLAAS